MKNGLSMDGPNRIGGMTSKTYQIYDWTWLYKASSTIASSIWISLPSRVHSARMPIKGMDAPHRKIMALHVGRSKFMGFVTQGDLKATVRK